MDIEEINLLKKFNPGDEYTERIKSAIEHLLAEREEDKKKIDKLQVLEDDLKDKRIAYIDTPEFEEEFIPKQKVKEKIEVLRKMLKATMEGKLQEYTPEEIIIKRNTLEELLEEK